MTRRGQESQSGGATGDSGPGARRTLGICLGATTLTVVDLTRADGTVTVHSVLSEPHEGNPKAHLRRVLARYDLRAYAGACVTGRKFRHSVALPSIPEPEAIEMALDHTGGAHACDVVLSAGGEAFLAYALGSDGRISTVHTGGKCASGTGDFFVQQLRRMGLSVAEAMALARPERSHRVSGRCSVFCKSDCTHALNKGRPREEVVAGLCEMIAGKMLELVRKSRKGRVLAIGGVTRNAPAMESLRRQVASLHIPVEAAWFEALGAGLWAAGHAACPPPDPDRLFREDRSHFTFLEPLRNFEGMVTFRTMPRAQFSPAANVCLVGLDVGSTTTKAVLLRVEDDAILASVYLRTNGDPVGASRQCYRGLHEQLRGPVRIVGLGVTGSGRQIAGLHALTGAIANEIIAHARAAVFFDPAVDTLFEIGGQDAKYTYLTGGVASDYAMNEACAAGTGSFLEEAAREGLGVPVEEIADLALRSRRPPNFNDQCSAFISSDIKNAIHEGIAREDIVAGILYSVCMNYATRVKGPRPVGQTVFMQGGVCYNRAVPIAMAALTGKAIVVPPEPGLMGAFGVALDVKEKQRLGLLPEQEFDLAELADRAVEYLDPFVCAGGSEACDRKCPVNMIRVRGRAYPFGGACNRYYNQRLARACNAADHDHIAYRQRLVFDRPAPGPCGGKTIGINRSFLTHTYYPLWHTFFTELGFGVVLPDRVDPEGIARQNAAFCFPFEVAHGMFHDLLRRNTDYLFLPHILELPVPGVAHVKNTCVLVQSEGYVLQVTFREELRGRRVLAPRLNFARGVEGARKDCLRVAEELGVPARRAARAFDLAVRRQDEVERLVRERAAEAIRRVEASGEFGVVLFGRTYNTYPREANMAIPAKFASRGIHTIPYTALPWEREADEPGMYWASGQMILKAARYVRRHEGLFAAYVTNFSCGPDSVIVSFFRDTMGIKPSLTLELDSQTADAGVDTRVEAFLDVVRSYRELKARGMIPPEPPPFEPPRVELRGRSTRIHGRRRRYGLRDIHLVYPSMGRFTSEAISAATEGVGIRSSPLPPADATDLQIGKGHSACKECLPLILTTGSLIRHLRARGAGGEFTAFFMPRQVDPCRQCQYPSLFDRLIRRNRFEDVAVLSLSDQDGYTGIGRRFQRNAWQAIILADVVEDAHNALLVLAEDPSAAQRVFLDEWAKVLAAFRGGGGVLRQVRLMAARVAALPLKRRPDDAPKVLLTGEIFVRKDDLSRQFLVQRLADRGFVVRVTPAAESVYYANYCARHKLDSRSWPRRLEARLQNLHFQHVERQTRRAMFGSGLTDMEMIGVGETLAHARHLVGRHIKGETSLTVGAALRDIVDHVSGVIAIGPFGCMPSRVSESVLTVEMTADGKRRAAGRGGSRDGIVPGDLASRGRETGADGRVLRSRPLPPAAQGHGGARHGTDDCARQGPDPGVSELPFLAIESDGGQFPQVIEARLDTFCLQVERLHSRTRRPVRGSGPVPG